jgi:hypothetical protein
LYQDNQKSRTKRFLNTEDIADIAHRYEASETTQQIGSQYGISKTRVATILREQGITIRRQGLTDEQVTEAATLYTKGKSLAWLGARYDVSHTTIATALRRQGVQLALPGRPTGVSLPGQAGMSTTAATGQAWDATYARRR